jgi:hypothetical protein
MPPALALKLRCAGSLAVPRCPLSLALMLFIGLFTASTINQALVVLGGYLHDQQLGR